MKLIFKNFDKTKIFHFNEPQSGQVYSVVDGKVKIEHENIKQLKKYSLVVVDLSLDHWGASTGVIDMVYDLLEQEGVNFIMLSHCRSDHQTRPRLYYFPSWLYISSGYMQFPEVDIDSNLRKYKLSSLSGTPKNHRIYNYAFAKNKNYFDNCLYNFHNYPDDNRRADEPSLDAVTAQWWADNRNSFAMWNPSAGFGALHEAFSNSYVNLVAETTIIDRVFISEKPWKPVGCAQLFLSLGNPGYMAELQHLGVDIFDDIIDHKYYDQEVDWVSRLVKMYHLIDNLMQQDLAEIYDQTKQRRLANRQQFFNKQLGKSYYDLVMSIVHSHL